jgi:hypothetical protein
LRGAAEGQGVLRISPAICYLGFGFPFGCGEAAPCASFSFEAAINEKKIEWLFESRNYPLSE